MSSQSADSISSALFGFDEAGLGKVLSCPVRAVGEQGLFAAWNRDLDLFIRKLKLYRKLGQAFRDRFFPVADKLEHRQEHVLVGWNAHITSLFNPRPAKLTTQTFNSSRKFAARMRRNGGGAKNYALLCRRVLRVTENRNFLLSNCFSVILMTSRAA